MTGTRPAKLSKAYNRYFAARGGRHPFPSLDRMIAYPAAANYLTMARCLGVTVRYVGDGRLQLIPPQDRNVPRRIRTEAERLLPELLTILSPDPPVRCVATPTPALHVTQHVPAITTPERQPNQCLTTNSTLADQPAHSYAGIPVLQNQAISARDNGACVHPAANVLASKA